MQIPDINYVKVDGRSIAWQQFGSGPDVLVIPGLVSNVELVWEHEFYRRMNELMAKHVRMTIYDKWGMGLSERTGELQTIDQRLADIIAVMDAAGLEQTHVIGVSEGGLMAQIFAARFPDRVDKMFIGNSVVAGAEVNAEHQAGSDRHIKALVEDWGQAGQAMVDGFSPTHSSDEGFVRWCSRLQRLSASQDDVIRQLTGIQMLMEHDPAFLADIVAPTLVVNSSRDEVCDPAWGDWLHERLANSQRVMVDTDDHFLWLGDRWREIAAGMVDFFTGSSIDSEPERGFGAVVFTDLVNSTATAAAVGDQAWAETLQKHDAIAWRLADQHRGTIIKSTGDGFLLLFDMPHAAIAFCTDFLTAAKAQALDIRAGLHCGDVERRPNGDITGFAVNLAARVEQAATDGAIWVSSTVRDMLMGGSHQFSERGEHTLKGFDDPWRLYELTTS